MPLLKVEHMTRAQARVVAIVVGLVLAGAAALGVRTWDANLGETQDADTELALTSLRARLDEHLQAHLGAARVLRASWQRYGNGDYAQYRDDALAIVREFRGFQALNWIDDDGIIRWVFPEEGNRAVIDLNLHTHSPTVDVYRRALANQDMAVSWPVELKQGGLGVVAYLPMQRNGQPAGTINAVFRLDAVLAHVFTPEMAARYRLRISDEAALVHGPAAALPGHHVRRARVMLGDRTWNLELAPIEEHGGTAAWLPYLLALGFAGAALVGWLTFKLLTARLGRREAWRQSLYNASHDVLTGLGNRHLFTTRLARELERLEPGSACAVILLNLGRFRLVNSVHGPTVGDALLQAVATRLSLGCGAEQTYRLAGDEFAVLLTGDAATNATETAKHLHQAVSAPYEIQGQQLEVLCALGVAVAPQHGRTVDEILSATACALDSARSLTARGAIAYDDALRRAADERVELEHDIRRGISAGEFRLVYQPIIGLDDGSLQGFEALVRWQHPVRGFVSPDKFIPAAEQSGLIEPLGRWILAEACRQARLWMLETGQEFRMSVNLSPRQLLDLGLPQVVKETLARTNLPPHLLSIEVTESVLIENLAVGARILANIRAAGPTISLDDFGTGFSSLSYLSQLPIDTVKIDRSFVMQLGDDARVTSLTGAIVQLAQAIDLKVVAEGVETEQQSAVLRGFGCDLAQGYLFDKPLPPDQAVTRIGKRQPLGPAPRRAANT